MESSSMSTGLKFSSYSNYLSFNPAVIINFFMRKQTGTYRSQVGLTIWLPSLPKFILKWINLKIYSVEGGVPLQNGSPFNSEIGCCYKHNKINQPTSFLLQGYEFDVGIHYIGKVGFQTLQKTLIDQICEGQLEWHEMEKVIPILCISSVTRYNKKVAQVSKSCPYRSRVGHCIFYLKVAF